MMPHSLRSTPPNYFACEDEGESASEKTSSEHNRLSSSNIQLNPLRRTALGVIQVPTDFNMDSEAALLISQFPDVELRMQKICGLENDKCSAETFLSGGAQRVRFAAESITPVGYCDMFGLACTSMSFTLTPKVVDEVLQSAQPGAKTTDMARSQRSALEAMGCKTVGLLTPYISDVHANNIVMLESNGSIKVAASLHMNLEKSEWTSMVSRDTLTAAVGELCAGNNIDAVVIGCSAFRVCVPDYITELEKQYGIRVVTSTQAFFWNMLRTAGVYDTIDGYGHLFTLDMSAK